MYDRVRPWMKTAISEEVKQGKSSACPASSYYIPAMIGLEQANVATDFAQTAEHALIAMTTFAIVIE